MAFEIAKPLLTTAIVLAALAGCSGDKGQDDDCSAALWYPDSDGDGYGASTDPTEACEAPEGFVDSTGDCSDDDASIHPGAAETCDGIDNDCDPSTADAGVSATTASGLEDITDTLPAPPEVFEVPADVTALTFCEGTHEVGLAVTSSLEILGAGSTRDDVVLSGAGQVTVLDIAGDDIEVTMSGLTLADAASSEDDVKFALSCSGSSSLVANDIAVRSAPDTAGIFGSYCDLKLIDIEVTGVMPDSYDDVMTHGGIIFQRGSLNVTRGMFSENSRIEVDSAEVRLSNVTIEKHRSYSSAAFVARASEVNLSEVAIENAYTSNWPTAVFASSSVVTLRNVTFLRGRGDASDSAAILVGYGTEVAGTNVTFTANSPYDLEFTNTSSGGRRLYEDLGTVSRMSCLTDDRDCEFTY